MISSTSGTEPVNFVRHDTPHPRELKARHQKLFANRETKDGKEDEINYGTQIESNVDQNGQGVEHSDTSSTSSVIIKNDEEMPEKSHSYFQNPAFDDHVDAIHEHKELNERIRRVMLSDSNESNEMMSHLHHQQIDRTRHVGFHDPSSDEIDEQVEEDEHYPNYSPSEKLNTRLHRRDTPHHLKNKRVNSGSKEEKDKERVFNILSNSENTTYGLNNAPKPVDLSNTKPVPVTILNLKMKRIGTGLGLSIAGGLGSSPYKGDDEGIFVSRITDKGPAEAAGLRVGDKILAVNNFDFNHIDHHEAVHKLKSAGTEFALVIERETPPVTNKIPPLPPMRTSVISKSSLANNQEEPPPPTTKKPPTNLPTIPILESSNNNKHSLSRLSSGDLSLSKQIIHTTLIRDENGLGFSIAGGKGATPYKDNVEGVFISTIFKDGAADKDGKLMIGDKILSINGTNLDGLDHDQVIGKLTGLERFVRLVIEREGLTENGNGLLYSANSYMANRPSYTGSYRRPMLGSVSSLSGMGLDSALGSAGTISTPATPSFTHTSKPMGSIFNAKLPGLRSDTSTGGSISSSYQSNAPACTSTSLVISSSSATLNSPNANNNKYSSSAFNSNTTLVNSCSSPQLSAKSASNNESGNN